MLFVTNLIAFILTICGFVDSKQKVHDNPYCDRSRLFCKILYCRKMSSYDVVVIMCCMTKAIEDFGNILIKVVKNFGIHMMLRGTFLACTMTIEGSYMIVG